MEVTAVLADNQALIEFNAEKIAKIKDIDNIEIGKTVFGGKITISQEDYVHLADLAKKQIATENKEIELFTEVERLKRCNGDLVNENVSLKATPNNAIKKQICSQKRISVPYYLRKSALYQANKFFLSAR